MTPAEREALEVARTDSKKEIDAAPARGTVILSISPSVAVAERMDGRGTAQNRGWTTYRRPPKGLLVVERAPELLGRPYPARSEPAATSVASRTGRRARPWRRGARSGRCQGAPREDDRPLRIDTCLHIALKEDLMRHVVLLVPTLFSDHVHEAMWTWRWRAIRQHAGG